ncbi:MAG: hypothetical protein R3C05_02915 [Pirellulaceae bacterium]
MTVSIDVGPISENGGTTSGTVHRNTDTTEALIVDLSSSDLGEATVPASVTIPAGSDSATFAITGVDADSIVDGRSLLSSRRRSIRSWVRRRALMLPMMTCRR